MDRFEPVIGNRRGAYRAEPGNLGKLQRWLNEHDPAAMTGWAAEAKRLIQGWGMVVEVVAAERVAVAYGLKRYTLTPDPDGRWQARPS